jgi:hypothetical protein
MFLLVDVARPDINAVGWMLSRPMNWFSNGFPDMILITA